MPIVHPHHTKYPAGRGADGAGLDDRLKERRGIELETLPTFRLDATKQPGFLELGKCLLGQPSPPFGVIHTPLNRWQQRAHASEIFCRCHRDHSVSRRLSVRQWYTTSRNAGHAVVVPRLPPPGGECRLTAQFAHALRSPYGTERSRRF